MVGVKDTEPVGQHLGKDEDVDECPGLVTIETCIKPSLKNVEVGKI